MAESIPTRLGDVLIVETSESFTMYVVGRVTQNGQQDFKEHTNQNNVKTRAAAMACAATLVTPGRRIFLRNIDTRAWSEVTLDPGM